ncbi:MAG: hypothetical protein IJ268_03160 [Proteobacteria bacterium]|nr:hypothetical protein [Pseudomonadota bacterium]MBQ9243384.1 hypothetical protein [Pseudomonadota bacterium]
MTPVGIMIIMQPAILCLGFAGALLSAGIMAFWARKLDNKLSRRLLPLLMGILFFTLFALYTSCSFNLPPVAFETITGL